ncbi:MAG: transcription/translation regulatory transformer protein RfaH [Pseudohongiella sp.]|nr:transcription/translation regulatory transformer protein RfaH [Pseudohongiella sp.]
MRTLERMGTEEHGSSVPILSHWYLLQVKTQQHARAEENLENQGFEFYSPVHKVKKIQRGHLLVKTEPLFPGYVFVQLDEFSSWRSLQATRGVTRIVSFNGSPQKVAPELIQALQQRFSNSLEPEALYKIGDKVVVVDGCFKHIEAIVKAVTSDERIIVLLTILNTQQAVAIPATQLAKAG